jgi:hypothetical protein
MKKACRAVGSPRAANKAPMKAKGRAKTVCSILIMASNTAACPQTPFFLNSTDVVNDFSAFCGLKIHFRKKLPAAAPGQAA